MGAENGNIPIGGTVAVLAQGPVGLMSTAGARLRGAGLIIGVESVPERQELARTYGADEIVDFSKEDVVGRILDLTDGEGVDTSIEALGAQAVVGDGDLGEDFGGGLTERELDVLLVLVLGRSNQEIADDLGISAKTVGHHVEHVYQKAGVRSRAAATLWAFEQDLVRIR